MDENKNRANFDTILSKSKECSAIINQACDFFVQIPKRLQTSLKAHLKRSLKNDLKYDGVKPLTLMEKKSCTSLEVELDKQLQAWKENPNWIDPPPEIKVSVPKGSLCNLNLKFKAGLPPDAIYNIVTDPDNRRVFKNIKEVISRRVLIDEGLRQVVEVEQAALWRFLWWSGTISVHVLVDQNRNDHTVKFTQVKSGFMKRFEGCWKVDPFFVDEQICFPYRPKTLADYDACTGGKGRVGSIVCLDQLIQPALVPPPPISWYLRGITTKTTEMLINDLLAEAARLRGADGDSESMQWLQESNDSAAESLAYNVNYIKQRWHQRRILRRKRRSHSIIGKSNSSSSANPM